MTDASKDSPCFCPSEHRPPPILVTHPGWGGRVPYLAWKEFHGLETTGSELRGTTGKQVRNPPAAAAGVQSPPLSPVQPPASWGSGTSTPQTFLPLSPGHSVQDQNLPSCLSLTPHLGVRKSCLNVSIPLPISSPECGISGPQGFPAWPLVAIWVQPNICCRPPPHLLPLTACNPLPSPLVEHHLSPHLWGPTVPDERSVRVGHSE